MFILSCWVCICSHDPTRKPSWGAVRHSRGAHKLHETIFRNTVRTCSDVEHSGSVFFLLQRSCCHRVLHHFQRLASARHDKACRSLFTRAVQTKPPTDPACVCSSSGVFTTGTAVCCCLLRTIPSYQVSFNLVPFVLLHGQVYLLFSCLRPLDRGPHHFRDRSNPNVVHHAFILTV